MNIEHGKQDQDQCITFAGSMTKKNARDLENFIIDLMRRYPQVQLDLSKVDEIDRCGVHFLAILKRIGGNAVKIIATSPAVDRALDSIPGFWYGRRRNRARTSRSARDPNPANVQVQAPHIEHHEPCAHA